MGDDLSTRILTAKKAIMPLIVMVTFLHSLALLFGAGLGLAIILGYLVGWQVEITSHVLTGIIAALGGILVFSLDMFYLIATGSHVKNAAIRKLVPAEDYYRTRRFKGVLFPLFLLLMTLLIVTPVFGAAYDAGKMVLLYHVIGAWVTLALYLFILIKTGKVLKENYVIFNRTVEAVNSEADRLRAEAGNGDRAPDDELVKLIRPD